MLQAEIIIIGNEILNGKHVDTNSATISKFMNDAGIVTIRKITVSDTIDDIIQAIGDETKQVQLKIISGGLGPTHDDKTKDAACKYFNSGLKLNEEVLKHIEHIFNVRKLPLTQTNKNQALVPQHAKILMNERGTAPGLVFQRNNTMYIFLPAVPFELEHLMQTKVIPLLRETFPDLKPFHFCDFLFSGIGESFLSDMITNNTLLIHDDADFAFLPSPGFIVFRQKLTGKTNAEAEEIFSDTEHILKHIAAQYYVGRNIQNIASLLQDIFIQKGWHLAVAESCTGGNISHLITSNSGSSAWFKGGHITYSNELKIKGLGVREDTILKEGAVSEAVVIQMAEGIRSITGCDFGIAVSGIAGPEGGSPEKPVGTVWIAVSSKNGTVAKLFHLGSSQRTVTIQRASVSALMMLYNHVNGQQE